MCGVCYLIFLLFFLFSFLSCRNDEIFNSFPFTLSLKQEPVDGTGGYVVDPAYVSNVSYGNILSLIFSISNLAFKRIDK